VSDDLTSTAGIVALVAGGIGLVALISVILLATRLRRVQAAQRFIVGESGERDLVAHAKGLHEAFDDLHERVTNRFEQLDQRLSAGERRLNRAISRSAVIRYDAYNEMSGRQSSSIALLDDHRNGVVLSSILHREQARLYAKPVRSGRSELDLSPEEQAAVDTALGQG
jgi:hypothetical protein